MIRATTFHVLATLFAATLLATLLCGAVPFELRMECPPPVEVACHGDVPPPATTLEEFLGQGGTVDDTCGLGVRFEFLGETSEGSCPMVITRTYQVEDECGQTVNCEQLITVWDQINPRIDGCPLDATLSCGVPKLVRVDAEDNCDTALSYTAFVSDGTGLENVTVVPGAVPGTFIITIFGTASAVITFQVEDDCGNQATCRATFDATCAGPSQGCTPGYWKNHTGSWDAAGDSVATLAGFTTSTTFNSFFGLTPAQSSFSDATTMHKAISTGGGSGNNNANLARAGIAALLSIAAGLEYDFPAGIDDADELIVAIHDAYVSGNFGTLAKDLDTANNAGCPLN